MLQGIVISFAHWVSPPSCGSRLRGNRSLCTIRGKHNSKRKVVCCSRNSVSVLARFGLAEYSSLFPTLHSLRDYVLREAMSAFVSTRGWSMIVWLIVFNVLLITVLTLRFYAARLQQRSFRLDDGFIIVAYVRFTVRSLSAISLTIIIRALSLHWKAQPFEVRESSVRFQTPVTHQTHQVSPTGWGGTRIS